MIIRHQGRTLIEDEIVSGYAVCEEGRLYIYQENGQRVQVRRSSVVPVLADWEKVDITQVRKTYGHPLCILDVSEYILSNLRAKGVVCLEDLAKWTYEDFKHIRGLGPLKIEKILEKLKQYEIQICNDEKKTKTIT